MFKTREGMSVGSSWEELGIAFNRVGGKTKCPECKDNRKPENSNDKPLSFVDENYSRCHNCKAEFLVDRKGYTAVKSNKEYKIPAQITEYTGASGKVVSWFQNERKISGTTLSKAKITSSNGSIEFNFFDQDKLVNVKYRTANKEFRMFGGAKLIFYNLNALYHTEGDIIITEGEIDALSYIESDISNVISVPNGASKGSMNLEYLNHHYHLFEDDSRAKLHLKPLKRIIIATDDDEAGFELRKELIRRIGAERCWIADLQGCNDPNELLKTKGVVAVKNSIDNARPAPFQDVKTVYDMREELEKLRKEGLHPGIQVGSEMFRQLYSFEQPRMTICTGISSHGKALCINTDIPVPSGFKKMRDINIGDIVYSDNGTECSVINTTDVMYNRDCFLVKFSDGSEIIADANHQWVTHDESARRSRNNKVIRGSKLKPRGTDQSHKMKKSAVRTTEEIASSMRYKSGNSVGWNHSIDVCKPIERSASNLLIPPYLLGLWLGDGKASDGVIYCDESDNEVLDYIRSYGYEVTDHSCGFGHGVLGLKSELSHIGVLGNKHIPKEYMNGSIYQRMMLLRGLMDSDGYVHKKQIRCEFVSTLLSLGKQVHELVSGLGIKATFVIGDAKLNGVFISKKYRVNFSTDKSVFRLKRKLSVLNKSNYRPARGYRYITSCERVDSVPVKCIEVDSDNHLFLASRSCIPTHNSEFVDDMTSRLAVFSNWRFGVFSPENFPIEYHISKLVSKITGKAFNEVKGIELDEAYDFIAKHFFWIYPEDDNYTLDNILRISDLLVARYGINGIIIDPWTEIDKMGRNGTEDINEYLSVMSRYKRNKNVHVFLVAHPTKMGKDKDGEVMIPSLMDISGSGHFYNKTDGGITIHRDFPNDTVRVFVNKVKFKHLGRIGDTVMLYNLKSGRYQDKVEVERDGWDDSNWLNREEQLTVRHFNETDAKELSQAGIMPRDEDDDLPF